MSFWKSLAGFFSPQPKELTLNSTYYYLCMESDYKMSLHSFQLFDRADNVLAQVADTFKHAAEIEGSCRLNDGRTLNYDGMLRGIYRWKVCAYPYGENSIGGPLVPMRSCAVDHDVIPLGSHLLIEGLQDIWIADDTGGAIKGKRIDLFTGAGKLSTFTLDEMGYGDMKRVKVKIV